jgi:hypothetical protein
MFKIIRLLLGLNFARLTWPHIICGQVLFLPKCTCWSIINGNFHIEFASAGLLHIDDLMFLEWIPCAWRPSTCKSIVGPLSPLRWMMESKLVLLSWYLTGFHARSLYMMEINVKMGWTFSRSNVWKTIWNKAFTNFCIVVFVCMYVKHWAHLLYTKCWSTFYLTYFLQGHFN